MCSAGSWAGISQVTCPGEGCEQVLTKNQRSLGSFVALLCTLDNQYFIIMSNNGVHINFMGA